MHCTRRAPHSSRACPLERQNRFVFASRLDTLLNLTPLAAEFAAAYACRPVHQPQRVTLKNGAFRQCPGADAEIGSTYRIVILLIPSFEEKLHKWG